MQTAFVSYMCMAQEIHPVKVPVVLLLWKKKYQVSRCIKQGDGCIIDKNERCKLFYTSVMRHTGRPWYITERRTHCRFDHLIINNALGGGIRG